MGSSNEILDAYLFEANSLLSQLDGMVLTAEQAGTLTSEDVNEIFRIMHTLKGSSAMLEFDTLAAAAHRLEDLFYLIREKSMSVIPEASRPVLFDLLFQAIDCFRTEITSLEGDGPLNGNIDSFLNNINSFIAKIQQDIPLACTDSASLSPNEAHGEPERLASEPAKPVNSGYAYGLTVFFEEGSGMENLRAFLIVTAIRDYCAEYDFQYEPQNIENHPELSDLLVEKGFLLRFRKAGDRDKAIVAVTASGSVRSYQAFDAAASVQTEVQAAVPSAAAAHPAGGGTGLTEAAAAAVSGGGSLHVKESLISVSLAKLDQLMAVVGEIVITESMVTSSTDLAGLSLENFTKSARQLQKLTDELQDVAMALRMVPVSATFQKMNRVVRDMGKKLGKQVKLTLVGEETEVDKTIVDGIADPIMHIVRNSMDHGIEATAEARAAAGKDPAGEIILSAENTGGEVLIKITDDGGGVDCDAVLAKALNVGLATPGVEYTQKEILNFLMNPGFSTNTEVTEYSGRGVGMDVVKKNVESFGGTVLLTSEPGKGMTTTLKIPLTMAIVSGMEVSVGDYIFTIPIKNIRQMFKIKASDIIHDTDKGEMLHRMDRFYPLLKLRDHYRLPEGKQRAEDGVVVWVESGDISYCLFVDELRGEQQVVVKPLPTYLNGFQIKRNGISGCTILGDGNISIIIDVANLYSAASD